MNKRKILNIAAPGLFVISVFFIFGLKVQAAEVCKGDIYRNYADAYNCAVLAEKEAKARGYSASCSVSSYKESTYTWHVSSCVINGCSGHAAWALVGYESSNPNVAPSGPGWDVLKEELKGKTCSASPNLPDPSKINITDAREELDKLTSERNLCWSTPTDGNPNGPVLIFYPENMMYLPMQYAGYAVQNDDARGESLNTPQEYFENYFKERLQSNRGWVFMPAEPAERIAIGNKCAAGRAQAFYTDLKFGDSNFQVTRLQRLLAEYPDLNPTTARAGYFDEPTLAAVKLFQTKFSSEVLTPAGLTEPNGRVESYTRTKLNALYREKFSTSASPTSATTKTTPSQFNTPQSASGSYISRVMAIVNNLIKTYKNLLSPASLNSNNSQNTNSTSDTASGNSNAPAVTAKAECVGSLAYNFHDNAVDITWTNNYPDTGVWFAPRLNDNTDTTYNSVRSKNYDDERFVAVNYALYPASYINRCAWETHYYCEDLIYTPSVCSGNTCSIKNIPVTKGHAYSNWIDVWSDTFTVGGVGKQISKRSKLCTATGGFLVP